jgi:hypothetical protein
MKQGFCILAFFINQKINNMRKIFIAILAFLLYNSSICAQEINIAFADSVSIDSVFDSENRQFFIVKGSEFVKKDDFREYIKLYKKKRHRKVNRKYMIGKGHWDATSIFFDINKIEKFITAGKKLAAEAGREYCGIRFYYAMYPRNKMHAPVSTCNCAEAVNKKYPHGLSHTLVMVGTEMVMNEKNQKEVRDITRLDKRNNVMLIQAFGINAENQGAICPPLPDTYCKGTSLDD